MRDIDVAPLPLSHLESHLDEVAVRRLHTSLAGAEALLEGRTVWTVTPSAAAGSGPAETVAPLVGYALGLGIDVRWLALDAPADFVRVAARLHAGIHGDRGDGGKLGEKQRDLYEHVLASNAENVTEDVREGDVVILHDPPTAGLARSLKRAGLTVIWRCHLGGGPSGVAAERSWAFLDRYLEDVDLVIVSREEYRPAFIEPERCVVVAPSVNPDSPKNRVLDLDEAWSVARLAGIYDGEPPFEAVPFVHEDGRPDAIRSMPSLAGAGLPVPTGVRTIAQVGRWDRLKGAEELIEAFATNLTALPGDAHLLIVGPEPDPNRDEAAAAYLGEVLDRWDLLPESVSRRVHIAAVPTYDREVNATVVNAVQRVADVVTQRSLVEAFGLPVAEAMWKKAPVVASAVGGIQDQIVNGIDGVLVDPADASTWAQAVADLLRLPQRAREMGLAAHESVRREFLPDRHLRETAGAIDRALELHKD